MSAHASTSRKCSSVMKSPACRTDLLSSPEMMGVRGYHDASCIPPVPSVVRNSAYPNMESKIPKPSYISKVRTNAVSHIPVVHSGGLFSPVCGHKDPTPPDFWSQAQVKESWRLGDDGGLESPKGMDPCRFASIKGKFEAMHKRVNEASPSPLGSRNANHSLPAARVQRIAESLARLEKVFPEAEPSKCPTVKSHALIHAEKTQMHPKICIKIS